MKLHNYIDSERILLNCSAISKRELFETLATRFVRECGENVSMTTDQLVDALVARDSDMTTGIGNGIALPHIRTSLAKSLEIIVGTLASPLQYGSIDGQPVQLFACLIIPEVESTKGLKTMALLMHFFIKHAKELLTLTDVDAFFNIIDSVDMALEEPILAQDIMVDIPYIATVDSSLKEVTLNMSKYHIQSVPVVDDKNQFVGEITCENLFNIGIPDFFRSLRTVSFVSYFDPFEEYFRRETGCTAKDVMDSVRDSFSPDKTMLEIVYALAIKRKTALFVVEEGKLVGMIDPATVMNRVINY